MCLIHFPLLLQWQPSKREKKISRKHSSLYVTSDALPLFHVCYCALGGNADVSRHICSPEFLSKSLAAMSLFTLSVFPGRREKRKINVGFSFDFAKKKKFEHTNVAIN